MRVLLVEDDPMIGESLAQSLRAAAYAVDWVQDGQAAQLALSTQTYGLMLLDLGLPKVDGMEILRSVRARDDAVPVLVITARDTVEDRISGLDHGADDYVLKPFEMSELLARMRAVIRRKGGASGPLFTNGHMTLDPVSKEVIVEGSRTILSAKEFALLHALMVRPGAILSRAELEDRLYGWNQEVESNAVEFQIHAIRKKLGSDSIKNVRGMGWMVSKKL